MWAELWISAASRPVRLRQRMVEHLADGLGADAHLSSDLPNGDPLPEDPIPNAQPLRDVAVHAWPTFRQARERESAYRER